MHLSELCWELKPFNLEERCLRKELLYVSTYLLLFLYFHLKYLQGTSRRNSCTVTKKDNFELQSPKVNYFSWAVGNLQMS